MANCSVMRLTAAGALALLLLAGCGEQDWGYLSGTVLLDGEPVGPGTISLVSTDRERPGATAHFGEDGKYSVMSAGRKEGTPAGEYQVLIEGGDPEQFGAEQAGPRPPSKIPPRYSRPNNGLSVTVEPGQNTHNFELTS